MTGIIGLGLAIAALLLAAVWRRALGERRWAAAVHALTAKLEAGRPPADDGAVSHFHLAELDGLPAPVQRFFRAALTPGQALVSAATLEMAGKFNLSASGAHWRSFTSRQRIVTRPPCFVWDARIAVLPGLGLRVVDSIVAGHGLLRAVLPGWLTLAEVRGDGEIAQGELMRWLAETAWTPSALLPSQGVHWSAVDDSSARATFATGQLSVNLLFSFNDAGLIGSFHADARGRQMGRGVVQMPWEGRFWDHRRQNGMMLPMAGEVAWVRRGEREPYFIGTVTRLSVELGAPVPGATAAGGTHGPRR